MNERIKNVLLTVLAALLLFGFALAVPSGTLTREARQSYLDSVEEEDVFIFVE